MIWTPGLHFLKVTDIEGGGRVFETIFYANRRKKNGYIVKRRQTRA